MAVMWVLGAFVGSSRVWSYSEFCRISYVQQSTLIFSCEGEDARVVVSMSFLHYIVVSIIKTDIYIHAHYLISYNTCNHLLGPKFLSCNVSIVFDEEPFFVSFPSLPVLLSVHNSRVCLPVCKCPLLWVSDFLPPIDFLSPKQKDGEERKVAQCCQKCIPLA